MEGSLIWLLTVTVPTVIAAPGWSTTPFIGIGIAEEIASAIFCDLVGSVVTEAPESICLKAEIEYASMRKSELQSAWRTTTIRELSARTTTTKTIEAGGLEENWTNSCCSDLNEYESDDRIEILSEVSSVFVVTLSGSSSETLTIAISSEDEFGEGPEITLEDAAKSKHLPNHGSRVKLCPETNEWI
jgi:hypothetical protein